MSSFESCSSQSAYSQAAAYCSPTVSECIKAASSSTFGCKVSCTGLYADVVFAENGNKKLWTDFARFSALEEDYNNYKWNYAKNIKFDQTVENLSKYCHSSTQIHCIKKNYFQLQR